MSIWRKEAKEKRKRILWKIRRKMYERKKEHGKLKEKIDKKKRKELKKGKRLEKISKGDL